MNSTKVLKQNEKNYFSNPKFEASSVGGFTIAMTENFNQNMSCICRYNFTSKTDVEEHVRAFHTI